MLEAGEIPDFRLFSFFVFIAFFLCCEVYERTFFSVPMRPKPVFEKHGINSDVGAVYAVKVFKPERSGGNKHFQMTS
jgi:hypothetical protein